jgi:hypothetical protein
MANGRKRRPDFRITVAGIDDPLEITNVHGAGHARPLALDYLERIGRPGHTITSARPLPGDHARHSARVAEAVKLGRVLDNAKADRLKSRNSSASTSSRVVATAK